MEEIAFSDWPGQPVDLSGSNPWLPAYGFQPPHSLLERDDFMGNPDADLFLDHQAEQNYVYLETIQEETSDDLRSESDRSESRASPVGWLATDSESGSVIRIDTFALDEIDSESEREIACPAKRRRQDNLNFLTVYSDDESNYSLSRSSSLLQFENLERQCQDISTSSPSILSTFSFDSLEIQRKTDVSPDSLERAQSDDGEPESEYYKTLKVDFVRPKRNHSHDSLLYNATRFSDSECSDSTDSDRTMETNSKSTGSLKISQSTENLQRPNKISAENLSEDSGYGDHFSHLIKNKSNSNPNLPNQYEYKQSAVCEIKNPNVAFSACDVDYSSANSPSHFGSSFHDLRLLDKYDISDEFRGPLIERFVRNKTYKWRTSTTVNDFVGTIRRTDVSVNIEKTQECAVRASKYNSASASEPNLLQPLSDNVRCSDDASVALHFNDRYQNLYKNGVCVCSVPKNLNLAGDVNLDNENWSLDYYSNVPSIAAKNYDIADFAQEFHTQNGEMEVNVIVHSFRNSSVSSDSDIDIMASYKREGSYLEAMSNRVDLNDYEYNSTLGDFGKNALRAISEVSVQSFKESSDELDQPFTSTPIASQKRNVVSTPNLATFENEIDNYVVRAHDLPRKSSLINRSTSTSGVSDEERTLMPAKSFNGSTNSKGVHFCPVVAEVNWHDDCDTTTTEDRDSTYSLSSSTPDLETDIQQVSPPTPPLIRPKPRLPTPIDNRISTSEPELQKNEFACMQTIQELEYAPLKARTSSQPDIGVFKRRGSQVVRKESDGSILLSYVDTDGVKYKHSHLGDVYQSMPPTSAACHVGDSNTSNKKVSEGKLPEKSTVVKREASAPIMEPAIEIRRDQKKSGKLGGFFSRLASFRFSNRKSADEKNKKKDVKKHLPSVTGQRIATKEDYIYIPLKGPEKAQVSTRNNNNQQVLNSQRVQQKSNGETACVSAKPPLPKVPPRVVGASVKRRTNSDAFAHIARQEHQTIDSGDSLPRPMEPMGLIETDLDTEVTVITSGAHAKTRSLMNLGAEAPQRSLVAPPHPTRPHKSMEFLLDKQNLKVVEPPENQLQKGERVMSEHQLRIQRSLQKLTIPDWYKQHQVPREGFLLKKSVNRERWTGVSSKTPSLSSLGSNSPSPLILSPTPQTQPFVRWSTPKLNSTASSPCASVRSSFNARQPNGSISPSSVRSSFSYRQPYLGWRSQERLTRPRTPAERLASSLLAQNQAQQCVRQQQQESPEIRTSIKEVTSAIVHYVSGLKPESDGTSQTRSSSVSPRGSQKLCWLESSFVGTRPLDTPQTPVTLAESNSSSPVPSSTLRLELQKNHNDVTQLQVEATKPSPGSTTLEDVLDSLLGLPPSTRAPSPSHQETASANTSPSHLGEESRAAEQFRRHSEGSEPVTRQSSSAPRRVSFHSSPVLRCRYSRCGRVVSTASDEARTFKHCHNCSYMYCSRSCRRAHWEKHRKSCLFSRVGSLCRQVLAASKERQDTLLRISLIARRGYLSHGPGAVKCFFACPETAEKFLTQGLASFGELTYVRWTNLLPTEMGPQMYTELVKMCKNYNPDTKLVLYVTVCVVSEVPASGAVKWERQLVSRCAKMRLSKNVPIPERDAAENLETLVLTCVPTRSERSRQQIQINLQNEFKLRGVSLKRQYPEIYQKLCSYVEGKSEEFIRTTVYPKDNTSGKSFMCIIMLESDPQEVKQVSAAGVRVNVVNLLENCDL